MLQWGRDDGVAEDKDFRTSLATRMATLQWGRDDGVAEDISPESSSTAGPSGFNGAATMGSRKTTLHSRMSRRTGSFNGAATMGSRKTWSGFRGDRQRTTLQWGRDDGVAEDVNPSKAATSSRGASMGPRRWGRGRRQKIFTSALVNMGFNGAATMGSRKTQRKSKV